MMFESTRPMNTDECMAYDLGRAESNAEVAALRAQVDSLTRERDAEIERLKGEIKRLGKWFSDNAVMLATHGIGGCCFMGDRPCAENAPEVSEAYAKN